MNNHEHESAERAAPTKTLLEQKAELERITAEAIKSLLAERENLQKTTAERLEGIAGELKALGYKPPRAARGSKTQQAPTE